MFKPFVFSWLLLFCFFNLFANKILKDQVVFVFKGDVITESDLRAFSYILDIPLSKRDILLEKVVDIEKSYYCLKENYPFEGDFLREFPGIFYQFNLLKGNRFVISDGFQRYGINFEILKENLFKLLFVIKYSLLLDDGAECLEEPVFFVN